MLAITVNKYFFSRLFPTTSFLKEVFIIFFMSNLKSRLMEWNTGEIFRGPLKIQENLLKKIIKENENTSYGKRNSFSKIDSINAFQERVPIIEYSSIEEEINLIK